jgi:hypothetical protein
MTFAMRASSLWPALAVAVVPWLAGGVVSPDGGGDGGTVTFVGSVHGSIPPSTCTEGGTPGVRIRSLAETTPDGSRHRSFELQMNSSCVAPLYQALFSRERLEARIVPPSGADRRDAVLVLGDARLTRVELSTAADERGIRYPLITLELTAARVSGSAPRARTGSRVLYSDVSPVPRGAAETWVRDGVAGTSVRLSGKPSGLDVTFASGDQRIAAAWSVDEQTGLPRDDLHISIDPIDKSASGDDAAVASAVEDRRELSEAVISFLGRDGAAGIVVWLKRASLAGFDAPAATPYGVRRVGHLSLVTRQLAITDIGSGRTAAFP